MTFTELAVEGVSLVTPDVFPDERGAFIRAWLPDELRARGLDARIAQCSVATNHRRGTLRGMHFQSGAFAEAKFVRVVRGAIFDVGIDVRRGSPTFGAWAGAELSAANRHAMYLPAGVAHGYQTLVDDTEVEYFVSAPYAPDQQCGVRWDDPAFSVVWPLGRPTVINARDAGYPDFRR